MDDVSKWVFPVEGTKATQNWNCEWGLDEDAKLMIGVWKYGHGGWEAMSNDPTLGLKGKFFLEDAKIKPGETAEKRNIPNSIHLVRRADYLIHLLHEFNNNLHRSKATTSSNRPAKIRQPHPDRSNSNENNAVASTSSNKLPNKRRATPTYSSSDEESVYDSMDEAECKESLRPVKRELKKLKAGTEHLSREDKLAHLKSCLTAIGSRIDVCAGLEETRKGQERRTKHLCKYFRS